MTAEKTGLVVTAHPGDFVWRAGGAIALHAKKGYRMKIVCLSFGERGESQWAWKKGDILLAEVKTHVRGDGKIEPALAVQLLRLSKRRFAINGHDERPS